MKKILVIILALVLCVGIFIVSGSEKIEEGKYNSVEMVDDFELNVNSSIVTADQLNGDEDQFDEFLTTDMTNYGDSALCDVVLVSKQGHTMIVVSYSLKNVSNKEKTFNRNVSLKYNDSYEYTATEKYWTIGENDDWHKHTSVSLNPLTTLMCKAYFNVPKEVVENTDAPLKLIIANKEYTIR